MQTFRRQDSYYEEYKRTQQNENQTTRNDQYNMNKLMTDRSSYMAFLEVELERVSSACMTVQGYKERLSEIGSHYNELEEKLQQYSRALKLSQTVMDRRDHESNHKFDTMESRLNNIERKQNQIETDCKMFLDSDMPSIYNEVKNIVKKQLLDITNKYAKNEKRCYQMIHERLDGYDNVYDALEMKLEKLFKDTLSKHNTKMNANNDDMREWTKNYMKQHWMANIDGVHEMNKNIKHVQQQLNERIQNLEFQMLTEQPKCIKAFIKEHVESIMNSTKEKNDFQLNLQSKSAERAELTCSKIADDIYKRLQNQRYDLFEHIKNVENRISHQLKETIDYISDKDIKRDSMVKKDVIDSGKVDLSSIRNEILDYRSEMLYSKQKLNDLENTFTKKLKNLQKKDNALPHPNSENVNPNVNDNEKLVHLDRKYSEIQTSIRYLQDMIHEHSPQVTRHKTNKKKTKKKKKKKIVPKNTTTLLTQSASNTPSLANEEHALPSHLTPHLNDLDNLVQCVLATDQIDKKHSNKHKKTTNNKTKSRLKKKEQRKGSTSSCASAQKPLWK
eukprot:27520_1